MNIHLASEKKGVNWEALAEIYEKTLGKRDVRKLKLVFSYSMHVCFLYDDLKIIGAGRILADGDDCAVVCDIAIDPNYQGLSLGSDVVTFLLGKVSNYKKVILYANPGKENFYEKFGFKKMKTAMAIFSNPEEAQSNGLIE